MARDYNGSSSRINWTTTAPTQSFTLACRMYIDVDNDAYCFGVYRSGVAGQQFRIEYAKTTNRMRCDATSFSSSGFNPVSIGAWLNVAGLFTVASGSVTQVQLALNGTLDTPATGSTSLSGVNRFTAGVTGDSTPYGYLDGAVQDLAYYDKLLTASEISALAAGISPLAVAPQSLRFCVPGDGLVDIIGGVVGSSTDTAAREGVISALGWPSNVTREAAAAPGGAEIIGDVTHTLTPAAAMAAGRAITGDVTHTLTPAAAMSVSRSIVGDTSWPFTPAAAMAVGRAITGDVTHTLQVAAAMSQGDVYAITGDVAFALVPAADMAAGRAITGAVTLSWDVAAQMALSDQSAIVGAVPWTLTPQAALVFSGAAAIVGDVAYLLIPAAQLHAVLVHAIAGDVTFLTTAASVMTFTPAAEAPSPLLDQIGVDLDAFFVLRVDDPLFALDLEALMDTNGFAVPCRYAGADFNGIFDDPALDAPGGEIEPASLLARSSDVAEVAKGDTVLVNGVSHVVTGRLPDGVGLTRLVFRL